MTRTLDPSAEAVVASFLTHLATLDGNPDDYERDYVDVLSWRSTKLGETSVVLMDADLVGDHVGCEIVGIIGPSGVVYVAFCVDDWMGFQVPPMVD